MATLLLETTDIKEAVAEEQSLPPGLYEVRFNIISPLSQDELDELHDYFLEQGVDVKGCLQQRLKGLYQVRVKYQKHAPSEAVAQWAALLIPLIPTILIVTLVGIGIFKLEEISRAIMPILLAAGGFTLLALAMIRKPVVEVAGRYIERKM